MATLRLLHSPHGSSEWGGERTDYGDITLLATDDVGGLEVRTRAFEWIAAPPISGAFVVNIGDCLMRSTTMSMSRRRAASSSVRAASAIPSRSSRSKIRRRLSSRRGPLRPARQGAALSAWSSPPTI